MADIKKRDIKFPFVVFVSYKESSYIQYEVEDKGRGKYLYKETRIRIRDGQAELEEKSFMGDLDFAKKLYTLPDSDTSNYKFGKFDSDTSKSIIRNII